MVEAAEPLTPEEEAALRELAVKHQRRHRWLALFVSVTVSGHTTIILHTLWTGWPPDGRELGRLACLVVNALTGLGLLGWSLRHEEASERQWTRQNARWQAESRAWRQRWEGHRRHLREGEAR